MSEAEVDKVVDTLGKFAAQASKTFRENKKAREEIKSWNDGKSFVEMDEEEIISFLNEYYLIYPDRLPDTQLY